MVFAEGGAVGDDVGPVLKDLVEVALQFLAAGFHLDEHALGPEEVGEVLAFGSAGLSDAVLQGGAGFFGAFVPEGIVSSRVRRGWRRHCW